jgi:hypothetical protein
MACDIVESMVGSVPLQELGERRGRRLVAILSILIRWCTYL